METNPFHQVVKKKKKAALIRSQSMQNEEERTVKKTKKTKAFAEPVPVVKEPVVVAAKAVAKPVVAPTYNQLFPKQVLKRESTMDKMQKAAELDDDTDFQPQGSSWFMD